MLMISTVILHILLNVLCFDVPFTNKNPLSFLNRIEFVLEEYSLTASIIYKIIISILIILIGFLFLLFIRKKNQKELILQRLIAFEVENKQLKTEKDLVINKSEITELENEKLKSDWAKLSLENNQLILENSNLLVERNKHILESEHLTYRIETLETESSCLKNLIAAQEELNEEGHNALKIRIEMLNCLLAGHITANSQYTKLYDIWVDELTRNTKEFLNSNRLTFQASHPRFIRYFEDRELTTEEINYVCLYAIGMRGKEVGNYLKKRSHVNISSAIRKKLGIDKYETNIGIYVRKLLKNL